ncbi:hypothetical protein KNU02_gp23 [Gordonia phage Pleakley]|uniref:Uncharacterized protein n=1 Tax=Gordonia phage Pleakley TaxID=2283246 RepID=A0A345M6E1_9CAUD|nr:hypothetical protein KNU02_gp23 [Gordonia phage Pleakley]AXH49749.1 hypothetical protein SEA_FURY_23 [Gordonia phage Fury]AXH66062.1 hypothetical protein SEA_PLEAKLEY_23 [Gordonia phage Pleakley]
MIRNAINAEVKERFGEEFFVRHSMVVALIERPRGDLEKPTAERFSLFLKSLTSIHPGIAINMLREAAGQFQAKKSEMGDSR